MNCTVCTDTYGEAADADGRRWRTLCACERHVACGRCKQRATHAFLDDESQVDRFSCDRHGVDKADREGIETVHGVKVMAAQEPPAKSRSEKTSGGVLVHIVCRCGKDVYADRNPTRDDHMKALAAIKSCSVCRPGGSRKESR